MRKVPAQTSLPLDAPGSRQAAAVGMSVAMAGLLGWPAMALAGVAPTLPIGLAPGSSYRLAFVTSTTYDDVSSTSISTYNGDVTTDAGLNNSLPSTTWYAIASTEAESAFNNINCGGCANDPIFLVDGTEVAGSLSALFNADNVNLLEGIDLDESGNSNYNYVWTGSTSTGGINSGNALGDSYAEVAYAGDTDGTAFDAGYGFQSTQSYFTPSLYAISGTLTVPGTLPEPTTLALLASGGVVAGMLRRLRRRRKSRD